MLKREFFKCSVFNYLMCFNRIGFANDPVTLVAKHYPSHLAAAD